MEIKFFNELFNPATWERGVPSTAPPKKKRALGLGVSFQEETGWQWLG